MAGCGAPQAPVVEPLGIRLHCCGRRCRVPFNLPTHPTHLRAHTNTPVLIVFVRGDAVYADQPRTWSLGRWRRPINAVALAFLLTTSVFFAFPPALPVTGSSMNYDVVVLAIVALLAVGTWVTDAHKNFYGPSELEQRIQEGRRTW